MQTSRKLQYKSRGCVVRGRFLIHHRRSRFGTNQWWHRAAVLLILRLAAMDMVGALLAAASARRAESGLLVSAVVLHHTGLGIYMYIYI